MTDTRPLLLHLLLAIVTIVPPEQLLANKDDYDSHYLYLGNYPSNANPGFHEDVQGVTNDGHHWYFTQSDADDSDRWERSIWKIPFGKDLHSVNPNDHDVLRISLDAITPLVSQGYDHFGDPSFYRFDGKGYIVVPIEGSRKPVVAVFRSSDLGYIGSAAMHPNQTNAGWCAIDPNGVAYSSNSKDYVIYRYALDWSGLNSGQVSLVHLGLTTLRDETGQPIKLHHFQGGVFSVCGSKLYLVSGFLDDDYPNDGISVFSTKTWRRVRRSSNGGGVFNYEFHTGIWPGEMEEPQGITIVDLDDGRAPWIRGQLHVLMLDNDAGSDEIYFKHYTNVISVNRIYTGSEHGTPDCPMQTINSAHNFAWDGATLRIRNGSYDDTLRLTKKLRLTANGGTVVIGRESPLDQGQDIGHSTYGLWQESYFGTADDLYANLNADDSDPDGDGSVNLYEFFSGTDPSAATDDGIEQFIFSNAEDGTETLGLTFEVAKSVWGTVDFQVECSDDLDAENWTPVSRDPVIIDEDDETITLMAFDDVPVDTSQRRFLRVRVFNP